MRLSILQRAGILICSLLLGTVVGSDGYDVSLGKRQDETPAFETVTVTTTVFTQFTFTATASTTVFPASSTTSVSTPIVTVTSTDKTTTTTTATTTTTTTKTTIIEPEKTGGRRKRQVGPVTVTSTTTVWEFPDATETLTVTVTASPQTAENPPDILPTTTTQVTTEINTVTVEEIVTSTSLVEFSPLATGSTLPTKDKKASGSRLAIILGTTFGTLLIAIIAFVAACLWVKKNRKEKLRRGPRGGATRSNPSNGRGAKGLFTSVLGTQDTTRYNTLSNTDGSAIPLQSRTFSPQLPSHSPPPELPVPRVNTPYDYTFTSRTSRPPQLPSLHIAPGHESDFEYTFGSPVSSIGDAQLNSLTSADIMNTPLPVLPSTGQIYPMGRETARGVPVRSEPPQTSTESAGSVIISPTTSIRRKPLP